MLAEVSRGTSPSPALRMQLAKPGLQQRTGQPSRRACGLLLGAASGGAVPGCSAHVSLPGRRVAENVHCLTEPEQKLPQGTPSTRLQSSREKLDWKKSCVSTSLTGFSSSRLSLALWCSVTTSPIQFYYTCNTMSPRLSVSGTVSPYL